MTLLHYESPEGPPRRLRWATDAALAASLTAFTSLVVSVLMYVADGSSQWQRFLAWGSIGIAAVALVITVIACFAKPRGRRLGISLAALVGYAALFAVALQL